MADGLPADPAAVGPPAVAGLPAAGTKIPEPRFQETDP